MKTENKWNSKQSIISALAQRGIYSLSMSDIRVSTTGRSYMITHPKGRSHKDFEWTLNKSNGNIERLVNFLKK